MEGITKRWIDGPTASDEDWNKLEQIISAKGWMALPRGSSRVLIAEDSKSGKLVGFVAFQGIPFLGPLHVNRDMRGTGLANDLNNDMIKFMVEAGARGWLVIAESKFVAEYCESIGMERVDFPVYVKVGMEPRQDAN